ncbi:MAG: metalloregulator ArsR/SmtB family transcription factor [Acidimicrobiia bacterium]|nr:MAG: metalloregulator ArsR/SmtB family transcription factor [Acidimicrobiia bacterium]
MSMEPRVRDFTAKESKEPVVDLALHSAADLLIVLWLLEGCNDMVQDFEEYGLGADWFAGITASMSEATTQAIQRVGAGDVWISVLAILADLPSGSTVDEFIDHVQAMDPVDLRTRLVELKSSRRADADLLSAAAEGDAGALEPLLALPVFADHKRWRDTIQHLLEMSPQETSESIASAMRGLQKDAFAEHEEAFRSILERDIEARRSMAKRMSAERLVELTTNGISIEQARYTRPILLLPTVAGRPWVIFTDAPDHLIMAYPVADEYMGADPDAPPGWLIKTYKALGDERRLRILRYLNRGPASLHELAEELDVSKSTLHHHMMLLRAAGLVKVLIGNEKEYALRKNVVPETAAVLQAYIGNETIKGDQ